MKGNMKKIIATLALCFLFVGCSTVEKALYVDNGQDNPATPDVNEGIVLNPIVEKSMDIVEPLASTVPFGTAVTGVLGTLLTAFLEVKRRKAKKVAKIAAIAIETAVKSEAGQEAIREVKAKVAKLADKNGVSKEVNNIVKEVS
jgi:hypothetical protein